MTLHVNPARAGMIPGPVQAGPRVRGKPRASGDDPLVRTRVLAGTLVNPARAGMIRCCRIFVTRSASKPRASGDDPLL